MAPPPKRLSKSVLSMFLRTKCDRELYLSLHTDAALKSHGLPEPLQARPGIGVLKSVGVDFEAGRNQMLLNAFGPAMTYTTDASGKIATGDMAILLAGNHQLPRLILQGKIDPQSFQAQALANIGVDAALIPMMPPIAGMIPDIVIVRPAESGDEEVLPSGARGPVNTITETRLALSIVDIKHTAEANPSYSAEVSLYAFMLSNWLAATGRHNDYFVTTRSFLWTRANQGDSALSALLQSGQALTPMQTLAALVADCEDINFRFYMPAVMRFFREDIPRVVAIGDADWQGLDWHVDSRCTACDWLGIDKWANSADKAKIQSRPGHYCLHNAELLRHLSRIAGVSRGARKTLEQNAIPDTSAVAATTGSEPAYRQHSLLKRDKNRLPLRADALQNGTVSADAQAVLASLAPFPRLHIFTAVNFDASAGLLTGLALGGRVTSYQPGQKQLSFQAVAYVVDQKTLDYEWIALCAFLTQIADYVETATKYLQNLGVGGGVTGQVAFWEKRQYEELCMAMGRHLPKVLALSDRKTKALAWMFPPEELLEKDTGATNPCVVFVEDIVRRFVFTPTPHVITLYDTSHHYYSGPAAPSIPDSYYREYLSNGVPRERIYEIWGGTPIVQRGNVTVPRTTVMMQYGNALCMQCRALDSIVRRLRTDFVDRLKGEAPQIDVSIPAGARSVAFDSKLWIWWDKLEHATARIEAHRRLASDVDALESTYEAIRLLQRVGTSSRGNPIYSVSPESTEVKIEDDDSYLAVGLCGEPGFPLDKVKFHLPPAAAAYPGSSSVPYLPFSSAIRATLVSFDRVNLRAEVRLDADNGVLLPYLAAEAGLSFDHDIFLTDSKTAYKWHETSTAILREVGDPAIAVPDPQAATAMALPQKAPGNSTVTPIARVLWTPDALQSQQVMSAADAQAVAHHAQAVAGLNASQFAAVERAARHALTVLWGPPGTGKTRTVAALIKSLARRKCMAGAGMKILISGPTYKAVEELVGRVIANLGDDPNCPCDVFVAYSRTRAFTAFPPAAAHLNVSSFNMDHTSPQWQACANSLDDPGRVTIVATGVQQAYKFAEWRTGSKVAPIFDLVVLDESSQMPVTKSVSALATLKPNASLVIAGDHLQMPPIAALEPPAGAEYLVGSIQTYLLKRFASIVTSDLLENYRSAQALVDYAKTLGYPQGLISSSPQTRLHLLAPLPAPTTGYPVGLPYSPAWAQILAPGRATVTVLHDDDISSQSNLFEARMVAGLVYSLRAAASAELDGRGPVAHRVPAPEEFWKTCMGVVTPHRAQRALVIRELKQLFPADSPQLIEEAVDTVEKFQGGERHVILVSFGVADGDVIAGEEAFLMQLERTNVAISRAMAKCVVIMPTALAGHIPQDKRALLTAHAIKGYVDDFCSQSCDISITDGNTTRQGKVRWSP